MRLPLWLGVEARMQAEREHPASFWWDLVREFRRTGGRGPSLDATPGLTSRSSGRPHGERGQDEAGEDDEGQRAAQAGVPGGGGGAAGLGEVVGEEGGEGGGQD
jgi:hypothetical protein